MWVFQNIHFASVKLIQIITSLSLKNSVAHTTAINPNIANLFKDADIEIAPSSVEIR